MSAEVYSFDGKKYVSEEDYRKVETELKAFGNVSTIRGLTPRGVEAYIYSLIETSRFFEYKLKEERTTNKKLIDKLGEIK